MVAVFSLCCSRPLSALANHRAFGWLKTTPIKTICQLGLILLRVVIGWLHAQSKLSKMNLACFQFANPGPIYTDEILSFSLCQKHRLVAASDYCFGNQLTRAVWVKIWKMKTINCLNFCSWTIYENFYPSHQNSNGDLSKRKKCKSNLCKYCFSSLYF